MFLIKRVESSKFKVQNLKVCDFKFKSDMHPSVLALPLAKMNREGFETSKARAYDSPVGFMDLFCITQSAHSFAF
jgi:hypothetical protein